ncbi:hypothetical protein ABTX35_04275 [Streptomyces sp. NPDC096080]|uniref:hypothetical protein n=1 Tax=Streptomyces sp. NPDC096080 TaxID=3156693 RepID=UPI0033205709
MPAAEANGVSAKEAAGAQEVSESEQLLFGGWLWHYMGWNQQHDSFLDLGPALYDRSDAAADRRHDPDGASCRSEGHRAGPRQ